MSYARRQIESNHDHGRCHAGEYLLTTAKEVIAARDYNREHPSRRGRYLDDLAARVARDLELDKHGRPLDRTPEGVTIIPDSIDPTPASAVPCRVPTCDHSAECRGLCWMHYERVHRGRAGSEEAAKWILPPRRKQRRAIKTKGRVLF